MPQTDMSAEVKTTKPSEDDKVLEMRLRVMSYASERQNAIAEYRDDIECEMRKRHREYEKSVDRRWNEAIAKHEADRAAQAAKYRASQRELIEHCAAIAVAYIEEHENEWKGTVADSGYFRQHIIDAALAGLEG